MPKETCCAPWSEKAEHAISRRVSLCDHESDLSHGRGVARQSSRRCRVFHRLDWTARGGGEGEPRLEHGNRKDEGTEDAGRRAGNLQKIAVAKAPQVYTDQHG